jgi:RNA polymerase sigma factor (sigma-70 family)
MKVISPDFSGRTSSRFGITYILNLEMKNLPMIWRTNCSDVRHPKSFLYTVANNAALNQTAIKKVAMTYSQNYVGKVSDHENPEYLIEVEEFRHKFDRAIAGLTEAQRTALLLNRIEGKKYKEIAEMLGISQKAVEKRIHGALIYMREKIDNFR